jgi:hypothetical protein
MSSLLVACSGGFRDVTSTNDAANTVVDLSAFVGCYLEIFFSGNALVAFAPAATGYTISGSGAVAAELRPRKTANVSGSTKALVPVPVASTERLPRYISGTDKYMIVRGQSGVTITSIAGVVTSFPDP